MSEKKYIDADSLKAELEDLDESGRLYYMGVFDIINSQHAADVAEIIRCKDCKYFLDKQRKNHQGICMCGEKDTSYGAEFYPYADDFCSYGERKDKKR